MASFVEGLVEGLLKQREIAGRRKEKQQEFGLDKLRLELNAAQIKHEKEQQEARLFEEAKQKEFERKKDILIEQMRENRAEKAAINLEKLKEKLDEAKTSREEMKQFQAGKRSAEKNISSIMKKQGYVGPGELESIQEYNPDAELVETGNVVRKKLRKIWGQTPRGYINYGKQKPGKLSGILNTPSIQIPEQQVEQSIEIPPEVEQPAMQVPKENVFTDIPRTKLDIAIREARKMGKNLRIIRGTEKTVDFVVE